MRLPGLLVLVLLAGVVLRAGAATGGGASAAVARGSGWLPATTLFSATAGGVGAPAVALDGHRRATAVWPDASEHVLMESDWTEAGGWTQARTLTALGTDVSSSPLLAVDARGDALMAWSVGQQLRVSYRNVGGEWQQPRTLSRPGVGAGVPQIAIDDRGRSLILWTSSRPSSTARYGLAFRLEVVSRTRAGIWGKPKIICACDANGELAMNASGHALVVWSPEAGLWDRTRSPAGGWSRPQEISSNAFSEALVLNSHGAAVVSFEVGSVKFPAGGLTVAIGSANGRFGRPQTIGDDPYWGVVLALAPTGEATVVWESRGGCGFSMSRLPGASSFSSQQSLGCGFYGEAVPEALAMDARGNALALWLKADNLNATGHIHLQAAERPAGGSFDTAADMGDIGLDSYKHSGCSGDASLALAPDGGLALAVWLARPHQPGGCTQVQAATLTR